MNQMNVSQVKQSLRNKKSNAQGHIFEDNLKKGCQTYHNSGRAEIDKTPEPFRVTKKSRDGTFSGRFTALAQPDFQGTMEGGRSIVIEAKSTETDRMHRNVLTQNQMDILEYHHSLGAVTFVCISIMGNFFTVPWVYWRDMKKWYGRLYVTVKDLERWRIKFDGAVLFLDFVHEIKKGQVSGNGSTGN